MAVPRNDELLFVLDPLRYGSLASKRQVVRELVKPTFTRGSVATARSQSGFLRTFAVDVPRIEWYDLDGDGVFETPGILLEYSRTNLILRSEELDNAAWIADRTTVLANQVPGPDGGANSADKLQEDNTNGTHGRTQAITITAGAAVSLRTFYSPDERTKGELVLSAGADFIQTDFDTEALTVAGATGGAGSIRLNRITKFLTEANGRVWYLLEFGGVINAGSTSITVQLRLRDAAGSNVYTGTTGSGGYYWGMQAEQEEFPSSYIKTTNAAVTRESEVFRFDNIPWMKGFTTAIDDITMYAEIIRPIWAGVAPGLLPGIGMLSQNSKSLTWYYDNSSTLRIISAYRDPPVTSPATTVPAGVLNKLCAQWRGFAAGGTTRVDGGSGFSADSPVAAAFTDLGDLQIHLGHRFGNVDRLFSAIVKYKIARGQFTLAEMEAV